MSPPSQQVVLERIYPFEMDLDDANDRDSLEIHQARYRFAADQLVGNQILDMACGCGFGTALMAEKHPNRQFTGVDIDPDAIAYAQHHYRAGNLRYICADAMSSNLAMSLSENLKKTLDKKAVLDFEENLGKFDSIVSLETIEHLPNPQRFINNVSNLLSPGGRIVASVPITPSCDGNPHHLHDFTRRSIKKIFLANGFVPGEELKQVQPWVYRDAFSKQADSTSRSQGIGHNVLKYYRRKPFALLTRIYSLLVNGPCNIYLTSVYEHKQNQSTAIKHLLD